MSDVIPKQGAVERADLEVSVVYLVELLGVGPLCTFDVIVELRRARREHEEAKTSALALLLELGGELTPTADLDGPHLERHSVDQLPQE